MSHGKGKTPSQLWDPSSELSRCEQTRILGSVRGKEMLGVARMQETKASCGQTGRRNQSLTSPSFLFSVPNPSLLSRAGPSPLSHSRAGEGLYLSHLRPPVGVAPCLGPPLPGLVLPPKHARPRLPQSPSWPHSVISTRDIPHPPPPTPAFSLFLFVVVIFLAL